MTIKKKLLTPAKFDLNTMKPLTSAKIIKAVNAKMGSLPISPAAKIACSDLIKKSASGSASFDAKFNGLTGADIGVITSDFGEVAGAIYMLNSGAGYSAAKFPISESERLVDYYLVKDGIDVKFSAKAGVGGAPSITALEESLNIMSENNLSRKHKKALKVLQIINSQSVYAGVLVAADYLSMPGYTELIKLLRRKDLKTGYISGIPKLDHLMKAVDALGTFNSAKKEVKSLFEAANFELGGVKGESKMKSVFDGTAGSRYKKWGLLHFPITSEVMTWLNDPSNGATEVLTLAARTLSVNQIYLDHVPQISGTTKWKSGELKYIVKTFSDASFKFHSPSSTPNPVGNRIGMKMIKG
jgi:hypothetical protein